MGNGMKAEISPNTIPRKKKGSGQSFFLRVTGGHNGQAVTCKVGGLKATVRMNGEENDQEVTGSLRINPNTQRYEARAMVTWKEDGRPSSITFSFPESDMEDICLIDEHGPSEPEVLEAEEALRFPESDVFFDDQESDDGQVYTVQDEQAKNLATAASRRPPPDPVKQVQNPPLPNVRPENRPVDSATAHIVVGNNGASKERVAAPPNPPRLPPQAPVITFTPPGVSDDEEPRHPTPQKASGRGQWKLFAGVNVALVGIFLLVLFAGAVIVAGSLWISDFDNEPTLASATSPAAGDEPAKETSEAESPAPEPEPASQTKDTSPPKSEPEAEARPEPEPEPEAEPEAEPKADSSSAEEAEAVAEPEPETPPTPPFTCSYWSKDGSGIRRLYTGARKEFHGRPILACSDGRCYVTKKPTDNLNMLNQEDLGPYLWDCP